ncbi:GntR family transcriptional regulator [Streptomyces sp. NPDC089919]|uniref:GntR family transcriptional regulator n=1 Tax=Streptomyces sp. NPDC089919 TaxID=3155188 RepID=UPI0034378BF0
MAAGTSETGPGGREAEVLNMVRAHVRRRYGPGDVMGGLADVAQELGVSRIAVRQAVRRMDILGEIAICRPRLRIVLGPGQVHPHDLPLVAAVGARIRAGRYHRGQALPTGLLGEEFGLTPAQVRRACTRLQADGLLGEDEAGPHGPAYYVT